MTALLSIKMPYVTKLLKRDLSISVLVSIENGLVNNLLELLLCQVIANHGLQYLEELTITDETVLVYVVDTECNWKNEGRGEGRRERDTSGPIIEALCTVTCIYVVLMTTHNPMTVYAALISNVLLTSQFLLLLSLDTELRHSLNELYTERDNSRVLGVELLLSDCLCLPYSPHPTLTNMPIKSCLHW